VALPARQRSGRRGSTAAAGAGPDSPWGGLEIAAVIVLAVGGLLAFVVPLVPVLVGLVLVWCSQQWTRGEKAVATGLALVPALLVVGLFVARGFL
jgi:hypothetical protein